MTRAAAGRGVDLSGHRSRKVTARDTVDADLILCMDVEDLLALRRLFPDALRRTTLLGLFGEGPAEIADPCELGEAAARRVIKDIEHGIDALHAFLSAVHWQGRRAPRPRRFAPGG